MTSICITFALHALWVDIAVLVAIVRAVHKASMVPCTLAQNVQRALLDIGGQEAATCALGVLLATMVILVQAQVIAQALVLQVATADISQIARRWSVGSSAYHARLGHLQMQLAVLRAHLVHQAATSTFLGQISA